MYTQKWLFQNLKFQPLPNSLVGSYTYLRVATSYCFTAIPFSSEYWNNFRYVGGKSHYSVYDNTFIIYDSLYATGKYK